MVYAVSIIETSGLNIILALSVYATLKVGQFSLAQVGFWSIGAYVCGILTTLYGIPLAAALLAGGVLCAAIGVLLGYPCLRIRGIYLTLATVAFSEVVRVFFANFTYQVTVRGKMIGPDGPTGFLGIAALTTWPQILATVAIMIAAFTWLERSRFGLSTNAVREDETAAACAGIDVVRVKVAMFAFGAFLAGVGGGLYATYVSFVTAEYFDFHLALISIFYVAVGGTENFLGPVIGAVFLTVIPELLRFLGDLRMIGFGVVVLGTALLFPRGIVGELHFRRALIHSKNENSAALSSGASK